MAVIPTMVVILLTSPRWLFTFLSLVGVQKVGEVVTKHCTTALSDSFRLKIYCKTQACPFMPSDWS